MRAMPLGFILRDLTQTNAVFSARKPVVHQGYAARGQLAT